MTTAVLHKRRWLWNGTNGTVVLLLPPTSTSRAHWMGVFITTIVPFVVCHALKCGTTLSIAEGRFSFLYGIAMLLVCIDIKKDLLHYAKKCTCHNQQQTLLLKAWAKQFYQWELVESSNGLCPLMSSAKIRLLKASNEEKYSKSLLYTRVLLAH